MRRRGRNREATGITKMTAVTGITRTAATGIGGTTASGSFMPPGAPATDTAMAVTTIVITPTVIRTDIRTAPMAMAIRTGRIAMGRDSVSVSAEMVFEADVGGR